MDRLENRIIFNVSAADKDRLRRLAEAEGRPLSNEVRRLVLLGLNGERSHKRAKPLNRLVSSDV